MSSTTVIAVSSGAGRCGQATSAISGSAEPHNCRTMCHVNHGSGAARSNSSDAQPICPTNHSAAHAPIAPQNTAWRPRHARRRVASTYSGASGGNSSAMLPATNRVALWSARPAISAA